MAAIVPSAGDQGQLVFIKAYGPQKTIAAQAEAERSRRAKVIHAEGEFQASQRLAEAAKVLGTQAQAIQLRYLQTLTDISNEKNSHTIVFPIPIDLISSVQKALGGDKND